MVRIPQSQGHPLLVNTLRTRTRTAIFAFPPIAPSHRRFQIYSYDKRMSSPARGRFAMFARTCLQRERTRHGHTAPAYLLADRIDGGRMLVVVFDFSTLFKFRPRTSIVP